jgi:hypothetical protein
MRADTTDTTPLSTFMNRDNSFLFFRRFSTLNVQNLLYMQSELTELEEKLKAINASGVGSVEATGESSESNQSGYGDAPRAQLMGLLQDKLESYSKPPYSLLSLENHDPEVSDNLG